jgi:hypothetical protein
MFVAVVISSRGVFPKLFFFADSFWLRNVTMDPHIHAYVNIECSDDRYSNLKIYISELILDSYEYILVACLIIHCII